MTYKNFDEYLMSVFIDIEHPTDDMAPDMYESWVAEQDVQDIIDWANIYGQRKYVEGQRDMLKVFEDSLPNLQEEIND